MKKKEYLTTGEVAKELGIAAKTLHYYWKLYPEIRKLAIEEKKIRRVFLKWPKDAPQKILKIIRDHEQE